MLKNFIISKEHKIAIVLFAIFLCCLFSLAFLPMTRDAGKTICIESPERLPLAEIFRKQFLNSLSEKIEAGELELVSDKIQYQKWRPWPMFLTEIKLKPDETSEHLVMLGEKWRQSAASLNVPLIPEVSSPKYDESLQMYLVRAKLYQQFGKGKDAQLLLMAEGVFLQEIY